MSYVNKVKDESGTIYAIHDERINGNAVNVYEVADIKAISDEILNALKAGDIVNKITDGQKHSYKVTYKKEQVGICLSYFDASVVETQSYDYTGNTWMYNSEDKTPLINIENAQSGTIVNALGLDGDGKLVKGTISGGGTKLYSHRLHYIDNAMTFISLDNTEKSFNNIVTTSSFTGSLFTNCLNITDVISAGPTRLLHCLYYDSSDNNIVKRKEIDISSFLSNCTDTVTEL